MISLSQMKRACVEKLMDMANNPNDYSDYQKGWKAGQLSILNQIIGDEE